MKLFIMILLGTMSFSQLSFMGAAKELWALEGHGTDIRKENQAIANSDVYGGWNGENSKEKAFDDIWDDMLRNAWSGDMGSGHSQDVFVGQDFGEPVLIRRVTFKTDTALTKRARLIASNDYVSWQELDSVTFPYASTLSNRYPKHSFELGNTQFYRYYAVEITDHHQVYVNGWSDGGNGQWWSYVYIHEIEMFAYTLPSFDLSSSGFLNEETIHTPKTDHLLWSGRLSTEDNLHFQEMTVLYAGSEASKAAFRNLKLYYDVNASGSIDDSDTLLGTIDNLSNDLSFTFSHNIDDATHTFLLGADIDVSQISTNDQVVFSVNTSDTKLISNVSAIEAEVDTAEVISGQTLNLEPLTYNVTATGLTHLTIEEDESGFIFWRGKIQTNGALNISELAFQYTQTTELTSAISNLKLYHDSNANGVIDLGEVELGNASSVSTSFVISVNQDFTDRINLILAGDVDASQIPADGRVRLALDPQQSVVTFNSTPVQVEDSQLVWSPEIFLYRILVTYTVTAQALPNTGITDIQEDFILWRGVMSSDVVLQIDAIRFVYTEETDLKPVFSTLSLCEDLNRNGAYDLGEPVLGTNTLQDNMTFSVDAAINGDLHLLVLADVSPEKAQEGGSLRLGFDSSGTDIFYNDIAAESEQTDVVWGSQITVTPVTYSYTLKNDPLPDISLNLSQENFLFLKIHVLSEREATLESLTLTYSSSDNAMQKALSHMTLYTDDDGDGLYSLGDTEVGSLGILEDEMTVNLDLPVNTELTLLLVGDINVQELESDGLVRFGFRATGEEFSLMTPTQTAEQLGRLLDLSAPVVIDTADVIVDGLFLEEQEFKSNQEHGLIAFAFNVSGDRGSQSLVFKGLSLTNASTFSGLRDYIASLSLYQDSNANQKVDASDQLLKRVSLHTDTSLTMDVNILLPYREGVSTQTHFLVTGTSKEFSYVRGLEDQFLLFRLAQEDIYLRDQESSYAVNIIGPSVIEGRSFYFTKGQSEEDKEQRDWETLGILTGGLLLTAQMGQPLPTEQEEVDYV